MTNKLTLTEQEELFAKDCKLINLKYEYDGYNGTEKWAVVTELTEEELWDNSYCNHRRIYRFGKRNVLRSRKRLLIQVLESED